MIITFDHWLNDRTLGSMSWASYIRDSWARRRGSQLPERAADDDLGHVPAFIDEGRWLVSCTCNAAAYVTPNDPYHICSECGREPWLIVDFPSDKDDTEAVLELRPYRATQNWYPAGALDHVHPGDETLEDLIQENRDHGVDVPDHLDGRAASVNG